MARLRIDVVQFLLAAICGKQIVAPILNYTSRILDIDCASGMWRFSRRAWSLKVY